MSQRRTMGLIWHRQGFENQPEERIDRRELAEIVGVSVDALSNLRSRYADDYPKVIASEGRQTWFSRSEAIKFGAWVADLKKKGVGRNNGLKGPSRTPLQIAESEIVRLGLMLDVAKTSEDKHKLAYEKAVKNRKSILARLAREEERVKAFLNNQ